MSIICLIAALNTLLCQLEGIHTPRHILVSLSCCGWCFGKKFTVYTFSKCYIGFVFMLQKISKQQKAFYFLPTFPNSTHFKSAGEYLKRFKKLYTADTIYLSQIQYLNYSIFTIDFYCLNIFSQMAHRSIQYELTLKRGRCEICYAEMCIIKWIKAGLPVRPCPGASWQGLHWTLLLLRYLRDLPQQLPLCRGTLSHFPSSKQEQ